MSYFTIFRMLCLILFPLALACEKPEENMGANHVGDPSLQSETGQAQASEIPNTIKIKGVFVPARRIILKSEFGGLLEDVSVVKGQAISKGSTLLRIDDDQLTVELDELRAELASAEAELEQNRRLAALREPQEETVNEAVITVPSEERVYGLIPYQEPTFSELASEVRFTSVDAGGIWPGIDPAIIDESRDPEDAGGIWPSYGEREMVNGERSGSSLELPFMIASLSSSTIPESIVAPAIIVAEESTLVPQIPETETTPAPTEYSEAENRFSLEEARIEVLQAKIALAENELLRRTLASPLDGKVLEVAALGGSKVEPGDFLLEIIQVNPIEFSFQIPRDQVQFLEPGMKITGRLSSSPGLPFDGFISYIGAELSPDKKTVEVRAQVDNLNDAFKVSMEASAEIATAQKGFMRQSLESEN